MVIGGGAAGLMAAISAARAGAKVTLLEQNKQVGKKLLATGNGRCNLANRVQDLSCYRGSSPEFVRTALDGFGLLEALEFFHGIGIVTRERNGYFYPYCDQASAVVDALRMENYKIVRDEEKCIGCGVCVTKCPTRAFTRSKRKYYRLSIMGRTGKRNPRLGKDFLVWADEDSVVKIILNTYRFVKEYIDPNAPGGKEHIGYIIDRVGFEEYKKWALDGVELLPETIVNQCVYWDGIHYD